MNRRTFIKTGSAAALSVLSSTSSAATTKTGGIKLGFTQYGMKTLTPEQALGACAEIGYNAIELALMPGYPTEPKLLSPEKRRELRKQLGDLNLAVPALMENLVALAEDKTHAVNLEKIKAAAQLAHDLAPDHPPVLETVLGGKPADWDKVKDRLVERLREWATVAAASKIIIAGKPHVGGALHTPEDARWLLEQVHSPAFRLAYDHSHYQLQGYALADTMKALITDSVFIHVKDARGTASKFEFLLPGDGTTDYAEYFTLVKKSGYQGGIVVEVSSQIFNKPGYDPIVAAKKSFIPLATAFGKAGIPLR